MGDDRRELDRRTFIRLVGITAAGIPVLAACGPSSTTTTVGAGATTTAGGVTTTATTTAAAGPAKGGELVIVTGDGVGGTFASSASLGPHAVAHRQFLWGLYGQNNAYEVVPALAEGYERSDDGFVHTFRIREGLTFHDGSPLTAAEVAENLNMYFDPTHPLRDQAGIYLQVILFFGFPREGFVFEARAIDDLTVEVRSPEPRPDLRGPMASLYIYNPRVIEGNVDTYGTDPDLLAAVGSGAFQLTSFDPGKSAEFARVEGFFDEAYLDRLRLQLVPDAAARFLALQSGDAQAAYALSNPDWNQVVGDTERWRTHIGKLDTSVFLSLNLDLEPAWADERVRKAVAYATNREGYVEAFWGTGLAQPSGIVALAPGSDPRALPDVPPPPYDPEKAKELLAEAGYGDGLELTIADPTAFTNVPELKAMMEAMAADLAKVGIDLKINVVDPGSWIPATAENDCSVVPYGNQPGVEASTASLYFNRSPRQYQTPTTDRWRQMITEARTSLDADAAYSTLSQLLTEATDAMAGVPIAFAGVGIASAPQVRDLGVYLAGIASHHKAWIEA